jgi:hypothetical protein
MGRVATNANLNSISTLAISNPSQHYWPGASDSSIAAIIESIPLALPSHGQYLYQLRGETLFISESHTGISTYRPTHSDKIQSIEGKDDGVHIKLAGSSLLQEVVLLRKPAPIAAGTHSLSTVQRERLDERIDLIGQQYSKRSQHRLIPSTRSTPIAIGESRSSGFRNTGG